MQYAVFGVVLGLLLAFLYSRSRAARLTDYSQAIKKELTEIDKIIQELETKSIRSTESYRRIRDEYIKKAADAARLRDGGDNGGGSSAS